MDPALKIHYFPIEEVCRGTGNHMRIRRVFAAKKAMMIDCADMLKQHMRIHQGAQTEMFAIETKKTQAHYGTPRIVVQMYPKYVGDYKKLPDDYNTDEPQGAEIFCRLPGPPRDSTRDPPQHPLWLPVELCAMIDKYAYRAYPTIDADYNVMSTVVAFTSEDGIKRRYVVVHTLKMPKCKKVEYKWKIWDTIHRPTLFARPAIITSTGMRRWVYYGTEGRLDGLPSRRCNCVMKRTFRHGTKLCASVTLDGDGKVEKALFYNRHDCENWQRLDYPTEMRPSLSEFSDGIRFFLYCGAVTCRICNATRKRKRIGSDDAGVKKPKLEVVDATDDELEEFTASDIEFVDE